MAVAAGQLPYMVVKLGLDTVPVTGSDKFSLSRDHITKDSIGVDMPVETLARCSFACGISPGCVVAIRHSTQAQRLALALKELRSVSTYNCRQYLDIYCPPARKLDLVQQRHRIEPHWQTIRAESGEEHRVGVYVLGQATV